MAFNNPARNNCLYFHINPIKCNVFYVGIGTYKRPYEKSGRSELWKRVVNKYGYVIDIIHEGLTWEEACTLEIMYIAKLGRLSLRNGALVNHTSGGEGFRSNHSEQTKLKIKNIQLNRTKEEKLMIVNKIKQSKKLNPQKPWILGLTKENSIIVKNMAEKKKGIRLKEKHRQKLSEVKKKQVVQFNSNLEFLQEFESVLKVFEHLKVTPNQCLFKALKNNKMYKNFFWKYKEVVNV